MTLDEQAAQLLERALTFYRDSPRADGFLRAHLARLHGPLRLAITGAPGSGRTTLLSAIVGDAITTDRLVVDWPGAVELLDVPRPDADATLFLTPQPGFDQSALRANPIAVIVVLSRADELGGGRIDAIVSARQVARRRARSPELSGVCQDVIAVSGLCAVAGSTLTTDEIAAIDQLGRAPRSDTDHWLLSVDRFAAAQTTVPADVRDRLLRRFGMFGVRVAVNLARRGVRDREQLSAGLVRASGISDLRDAIGACFVDRAPVLLARSALTALDVVLRMEPRADAGPVAADLERILAGAHDLRELRLLAALRTGRVSLGDTTDEATCLLGAHGTSPTHRLSLSGDPYDALLRWRGHAEDPSLGTRERQAAAVIARTCEALISQ